MDGGTAMGGGAGHQPVMSAETLGYLAPGPGRVMVDATLGCGGHALALARALQPGGLLIGVDRDPLMVERTRELLARENLPARLFSANYDSLDDVLRQAGVSGVDGILMDLGACSAQLDDPARGFSYRVDGPLSMEMTPNSGMSAADMVNQLSEEELAEMIREYGEERYARRIARAIVAARALRPLTRTLELAEVIARATPRGSRRLHPARRTFQALRIATNQEIAHLRRAMELAPGCLSPGGRVVVLSYHSLEDREVKQAFRARAAAGELRLLTRKVARPTAEEIQANPRARSAKLRAAERITAEQS